MNCGSTGHCGSTGQSIATRIAPNSLNGVSVARRSIGELHFVYFVRIDCILRRSTGLLSGSTGMHSGSTTTPNFIICMFDCTRFVLNRPNRVSITRRSGNECGLTDCV